MHKIFLVGLLISIFGFLNAAEMSIDVSEKIDISSDNIEIKEGKIEFRDNVIPSSNSIMAKNLFKLYHYFDKQEYFDLSKKMALSTLK